MKKIYYILGCLATFVGIIASLYSCTDELEGVTSVSTRPTDVVCFTASLSDGRGASVSRGASGQLEIEQEEWLVGMEQKKDGSRGAPVSLLSGSAGVIGLGFGDNDTESVWSNNAEYQFDGDELTANTGDVRWSTIAGNKSVSCHVYAPYTSSNISGKTIKYQVPTTVTEQQDLIVASWTGAKGTNYGTKTEGGETVTIQPRTIPLVFEHALTAVKFKVGFNCIVTELKVNGIYNSGIYTFGSGWSVNEPSEEPTDEEKNALISSYTFEFGEDGVGTHFAKNAVLTDGESTLMMIPQTLPEGAQVVLRYKENADDEEVKTITSSLEGKVWQEGKMITYTIHQVSAPSYIYFDLAAGNVMIGVSLDKIDKDVANDKAHGTAYRGYVYVNGEIQEVQGQHNNDNVYYVYQSSTNTDYTKFGPTNTGYASDDDYINKKNCRIPAYSGVTYNNKPWADFITNNTSVDDVIEIWDDGKYVRDKNTNAAYEQNIGVARVREVGRTHTENHILVKGQGTDKSSKNYNLIVDDIYSSWQFHDTDNFRDRNYGGITYYPNGYTNLTINFFGDNRLGYIHINNQPTDTITFEGTGTLTIANSDFITPNDFPSGDVRNWNSSYYGIDKSSNERRYISNHRKSAIGNDTDSDGQVHNLVFNSGTIFAGTTKIENCSAIGGGGNGYGHVVINGGTITAIATTTGTAVGGGIGFSDVGGEGHVYITNGNVYAYNFANKWDVPSSAIGGGGSKSNVGKLGEINISGGYVYAYSALGTAIGGGSSFSAVGGDADIKVTGGQVIAKSGTGAGIGGGSSCTGGNSSSTDGGTATVTISGNPIIRTGSIGGGTTGASKGKIGSANIEVYGGDIQAQFVMAAGAKATPSFIMYGGTIRNSDVNDDEYIHLQKKGGAVYLEDGTFTMYDGIIKNCSAVQGGAVYIDSQKGNSTFTMEGGEIHSCFATGGTIDGVEYVGHGGAVCLNGGQVVMKGGTIRDNYSENGDGGAIYINNGNFTMGGDNNSSPTISGNSAQKGNGGGVFVSSASSKNSVQVNLLHGLITGNAAVNYGGGVCVDMGVGSTYAASVIVGEARKDGEEEDNNNPKISGNTSLMAGGGLYVRGVNANITINGGNIKDNEVSAYVKNAEVANEGGMVTLNADKVTDIVTITFHDIDGEGKERVYSQKVVVNTNTNLTKCEEIIDGKKFVCWNNRPDGYGSIKYGNGAKINTSESIDLYAIRVDQ